MLSVRDQREIERRLARVLRGADWRLACGAIGQLVADQAWARAVARGELDPAGYGVARARPARKPRRRRAA